MRLIKKVSSSHCGHILSFMNNYPKSKYCPNCGVRMDGDAE